MYIVQIVTQEKQTVTYTGLPGPLERARKSGIERFRLEHPDQAIRETFAFTEQEYYGFHECQDSAGRGCCEVCGGVIAGSSLDREVGGGD